jgi:hypothetical protein
LELTRSGFGAFAVCGFFSVLGLKLTAFWRNEEHRTQRGLYCFTGLKQTV